MPDPTTLDRLAPWLRLQVARLRSEAAAGALQERVEVVTPAVGERAAQVSGQVPGQVPGCGVLCASWPSPVRMTTLDRGLRVDLVAALTCCVPGPCAVVLSRAEHHATCSEEDLAWIGAADAAAGVTAVDLAAVVTVSRWGWLDLLSGRRRDWKRLRIRPA